MQESIMVRATNSGLPALVVACFALAAFDVSAQSAKKVDPYTGNADAIAQGEQLFMSKSCSGCHGAGGGGGMGPPVTNDVWIYAVSYTHLTLPTIYSV